MKIALATCRNLPDWEVDDRPLEAAFRDLGAKIAKPIWDDDAIDWSTFDACLIRTTWDYSQRRETFVAWADRVATCTRLFNSPTIVRWNTDKRYLRELETKGVPAIPTIWIARGGECDIASALAAKSWRRGFLKPVVGASSSGTLRFSTDDAGLQAAQAHLDQWMPTHDMMLQPYYDSVEIEGEYSVIFVEGEPTHAVRKVPVPGDYRVQDDYGAHDEPASLTDDDIRVASAAVAAVGQSLLYARADFLRCPDGLLRMNELELVEPSLFFRHGADAAERLARAMIERVNHDNGQSAS